MSKLNVLGLAGLWVLAGLLLGCNLGCNLGDGGSLVGSYVNHSEGEYSIADDTLVVLVVDRERLKVQRRTGFNLIREGVAGGRELETEEWMLVYDREMSAYRELRWGKVLRWDVENKVLRIGSRAYQKIN